MVSEASASEGNHIFYSPSDDASINDEEKTVESDSEMCDIPGYTKLKATRAHYRSVASKAEGCTLFILFLIFISGLFIVLFMLWIFPGLNASNVIDINSDELPSPQWDVRVLSGTYDPIIIVSNNTEGERQREILETFVIEEAYPELQARFFAFSKAANKTNAKNLCSGKFANLPNIATPEVEKAMGEFLIKVQKEIDQTNQQKASVMKIWTGGIIYGETPTVIQWNEKSLTLLDQSDELWKQVVDDKLWWNGQEMAVVNYTNVCDQDAWSAEIKASIVRSRGIMPLVIDVIFNTRINEDQTKATSCWTVESRNISASYSTDVHNFVCKANTKTFHMVYNVDPEYVAQRYSKKWKAYYKFFASKQALTDAIQICANEQSKLLSFYSAEEEKEFDKYLRNAMGNVLFQAMPWDSNGTVDFFTNGWFSFSLDNSETVMWKVEESSPLPNANHMKFCDGEKERARDLYKEDPVGNQVFVLLKSFYGIPSADEWSSCWKLLPGNVAKDPTIVNHFTCQLNEADL